MLLDGYERVIEAAAELGITSQQVRRLVQRGQLRAVQLSPRLYLVERASVEAYKRQRRPAGRPRRPDPP